MMSDFGNKDNFTGQLHLSIMSFRVEASSAAFSADLIILLILDCTCGAQKSSQGTVEEGWLGRTASPRSKAIAGA